MSKLYKIVLDKKIKSKAVTENKPVDKDSIIIKVRLREAIRKVNILNTKIKNFDENNKKGLIQLKMSLKKEMAKVKILEG